MKPAGRWISAALLPLAAFLLYAAQNTSRSMLYRLDDPYRIGEALPDASASQEYWLYTSCVGALGLVLASLGTMLTGPRLMLVISSLLAALSMLATAVLADHGGRLAFYGVALGMGMTSVALYSAAAQAFDREREHLRDALCVLIYAMANAAVFCNLITDHVESPAGARVFSLFAGGGALLAAALAGAVALVVYKSRDPDAVQRALRPQLLGLVVGMGLVLALVWSTTTSGFQLGFGLYSEFPRVALYLDPASCLGFGLVLALIFGLLRAFDKRVPTLVVAGAGFVLASFALALLLVGTPDEGNRLEGLNAILLSLGIIALGGAQVLATPLLISRFGGDLPARFTALPIAALLLVPRLTSIAQSAMHEPGDRPSNTLAYVGVAACMIFGIALIAAAFPLRRFFNPAEDAPAEF